MLGLSDASQPLSPDNTIEATFTELTNTIFADELGTVKGRSTEKTMQRSELNSFEIAKAMTFVAPPEQEGSLIRCRYKNGGLFGSVEVKSGMPVNPSDADLVKYELCGQLQELRVRPLSIKDDHKECAVESAEFNRLKVTLCPNKPALVTNDEYSRCGPMSLLVVPKDRNIFTAAKTLLEELKKARRPCVSTYVPEEWTRNHLQTVVALKGEFRWSDNGKQVVGTYTCSGLLERNGEPIVVPIIEFDLAIDAIQGVPDAAMRTFMDRPSQYICEQAYNNMKNLITGLL